MSAPVQLAAQALLRHGEYLVEGNPWGPAEQDAIAWLAMEAADLAKCTTEAEVIALLADTSWWDPTQESADRAQCVAAELGLF